MLKTAAAKLDITRRDLRNFVGATAILTGLLVAGVDIAVPAHAPHGAVCRVGNLLR
jgi:hypothetical protein